MIYYKISFLIVLMISVVCFSANNPEEEEYFRRILVEGEKEARRNALEKCLFSMLSTFKELYGDNAFEYDDHVKQYCESFPLYINYDKLKLPIQYCGPENQTCLDQTLPFLDTPIHELRANATNHPGESSEIHEVHENVTPNPSSLVDLTDEEISIVEKAINDARQERGGGESTSGITESQTEPTATLNDTTAGTLETFTQQPAPSSSEEPHAEPNVTLNDTTSGPIETVTHEPTPSTSKDPLNLRKEETNIEKADLKRNVMMNALFYHVIFDRRKGFQPPADESRKYFHEAGTHGASYLADIARLIELNRSTSRDLVYPAQYCRNLYNA